MFQEGEAPDGSVPVKNKSVYAMTPRIRRRTRGGAMVGGVTDRAFLFLHGFSHHRPPGHWQYWLADRLRARGERVLYPGLPFEDDPRYAEWREALHWSLLQLGEGERVVVCNSLACLLWIRFAAERRADEEPVDRLLLVSPPDSPQVPDKAASFRLDYVDGAAVRASARTRIRIACSDADPFNPRGAERQYAADLGAEVNIIPGAGHLGPIEGYGPWPSIEAWCLDPAERIVPNFS
jgi:predicted alpha/beta hydrolase family esterase